MNTITEVEKLNAAQKLTTTIIPSSTVNMISKEDQCFQCQEPEHIHNAALTPNAMNVMNMDISSWTALTKYSLQEHWHHITRHTETTAPDQALGTTRKTEKEETDPDHSLGTAGITAPVIVTCTEAASDHNNGMDTATIEAAQDDPIQHTKDTVTDPTVTHHTGHTANHPQTAAHEVTTLRTAVNHIHTHPTDL